MAATRASIRRCRAARSTSTPAARTRLGRVPLPRGGERRERPPGDGRHLQRPNGPPHVGRVDPAGGLGSNEASRACRAAGPITAASVSSSPRTGPRPSRETPAGRRRPGSTARPPHQQGDPTSAEDVRRRPPGPCPGTGPPRTARRDRPRRSCGDGPGAAARAWASPSHVHPPVHQHGVHAHDFGPQSRSQRQRDLRLAGGGRSHQRHQPPVGRSRRSVASSGTAASRRDRRPHEVVGLRPR